jgi:hypothetical protein
MAESISAVDGDGFTEAKDRGSRRQFLGMWHEIMLNTA